MNNMITSQQFGGWLKIDKNFFQFIEKGDILCDMETYYAVQEISEKSITYVTTEHKDFSSTKEKIFSGETDSQNFVTENLDIFNKKCRELLIHPHKKNDWAFQCEKCGKIIYVKGHGFIDSGAGVCEVCERELCSDCGDWDYDTGDCKDCVDKRKEKNAEK